MLEDKAKQAFDALLRGNLPAYVAHILTQLSGVTIERGVTRDAHYAPPWVV